ncbi:unnamed protein product, partial [Ectocarpus sp. 6 AP-2014]
GTERVQQHAEYNGASETALDKGGVEMTSYRGHRGPFRVGLLVFAVASWRLILTTGTETDTLPSPSIGGEHSNSNDGPLKSDTVSPGIAQVASTGTRSPQDDSSDGNGRNPQSSGSRANAVW